MEEALKNQALVTFAGQSVGRLCIGGRRGDGHDGAASLL